jgi:predicted ATP-grasp superfamily ATP-dependent carboligase
MVLILRQHLWLPPMNPILRTMGRQGQSPHSCRPQIKKKTLKNNSIAHNAIVLGSHTTALYVVRCLGRLGANLAVIDTHHHGEARFSRYCNDFVKIERFSPDELRTAIDEISRKLGACAIFPSNDEAAKALSQSIDSLPQGHLAVIAPWKTTLRAYDKRLTYELALASDIPMPKTFYPEARSDIDAISRDCEYRVLVKPTTTAELRSTFGTKAIGAIDSTELKTRFEKIITRIQPTDLLIQEIVPGTNRHFWHYGAVFNQKKPLVEYVISRKRQYPIDFGTASHAEIRANPL